VIPLPRCQYCWVDVNGCSCKASDAGCWYCAPNLFQRPICYHPPEGYRWVKMDTRGQHLAIASIFKPQESLCKVSFASLRQPMQLLWWGREWSPNPEFHICPTCISILPTLSPWPEPVEERPVEVNFDHVHHKLQQAKHADSLARMLDEKGDEKGAESQRVRAAKLRSEAEAMKGTP
jgi:hypothetical protein